jgi:hypothetical protein
MSGSRLGSTRSARLDRIDRRLGVDARRVAGAGAADERPDG